MMSISLSEKQEKTTEKQPQELENKKKHNLIRLISISLIGRVINFGPKKRTAFFFQINSY